MKKKVLCTSAFLSKNADERNEEYRIGIQRLLELGVEPYVVESTATRSDVFHSLLPDEQIFYADTNNPTEPNKGVNEFKSMIKALEHFQFDKEEVVYKMTGRYFLETDSFFRMMDQCAMDAGFHQYPDGQLFTGFFACRVSLLNEFLNSVNYDVISKKMVNVERVASIFFKNQRTAYVKKLDIVGKCGLGVPFTY